MSPEKSNTITQLKKELLTIGGYKFANQQVLYPSGLAFMNAHFPNSCFPKGAIHEFLCGGAEATAATMGFIAAMISSNFNAIDSIIYVGTRHFVYPLALTQYGLEPWQLVFVQPNHKKAGLWAIEEALKCEGLTVVIAELEALSFVESRRFQLAVEGSGVTGLLLNLNPKAKSTTASIARWQIGCKNSKAINALPGVGHQQWLVNLQKIRHGKPGQWAVEWDGSVLAQVDLTIPILHDLQLKNAI
ncbi:MAG: Error-prone repair protein ImuA [Bacteroidetes bacterium]|nr:MAG: Error-prone repair protein ImuA [Bacteroidota bacterium]